MSSNNTNSDPDVNMVLSITNTTTNRALELIDALDELSDNEEVEPIPRAPRRYLHRDRHGRATALWNDYFSDDPTYPDDYFRNRFRMSKPLFFSYMSSYFIQRRDATGLLGFNIVQKVTSTIRQLAYVASANVFDEYLHMCEHTSYDCLNNFCKCVFHLYGPEYLRKPNAQDVQRLTTKHAQIHGFPGMLGSIDSGEAPPYTYTVNGCTFTKGYYLEDGIYSEWSTLVKSFRNSIDPKQKKFKRTQLPHAVGVAYFSKQRKRMYVFMVLHVRLYMEIDLARELIKGQYWTVLQEFDRLQIELKDDVVFQGWR
ncbi:uncharacterized protein [Rutidosis leptorrhynchoides]|uniref:uncharacterized protein n=1 Tax=Rutidosis leptorrhynchoides TaxID=125765 RepID=UPI003A98DDCF